MIILSQHQARVYFTIRTKGPIGPSKLGHELDFAYDHASASVTRPIKKLLSLGLIEADRKNRRVVKYKVVAESPPPIMLLEEDRQVYAIPKEWVKKLKEKELADQ